MCVNIMIGLQNYSRVFQHPIYYFILFGVLANIELICDVQIIAIQPKYKKDFKMSKVTAEAIYIHLSLHDGKYHKNKNNLAIR